MTDRPPTNRDQAIGFRRWLLAPALNTLNRMETFLMASLDQLQAAADRNGTAIRDAVTALVDQRQKIAALEQAVSAGNVDQERLAAITASIDAASDAVAQALAPVVADPVTDTGTVEVPPAENPDTQAPESVPESVPAGEPLQV